MIAHLISLAIGALFLWAECLDCVGLRSLIRWARCSADRRKPTLAERRAALGFAECSADERRASLEDHLR